MQANRFIAANAVVGFIFGLLFLLDPAGLSLRFGATLDATGRLVARAYGAELLGFSIATWLARTNGENDLKRAIILSHLVSGTLTFLVVLFATASRVINPLGWSIVALTLFFSLGYGYLQFARRAVS